MKYSVVIVGGGITGLSVAYSLALRGVEGIAVIERNYLGSGSTFRCAGGIRASFTSREHIVLMRRSIELWGKLAEDLGVKYSRSGYLWLSSTEKGLEKLKSYMRIHNENGVPTRLVDESFIREVAPYVSTERLVGALFDPLAGKASPFDTVYKLYSASRRLGVEIRVGESAVRVEVSNSAVEGVQTDRGYLSAETVVLATGPYINELLEPLGVNPHVSPVPHHAAITEEFGRLFDPLIIDFESGAYAVQTFHGNVLMGVEIPEEPFSPLDVKLEFLWKVVREWSKWLPWLPDVNILRYWPGYYEVTPDHHPILGPVDAFQGLYVASGFSGHGFMMGPVVGEVMADWIVKGRPGIPEAKNLTLDRFERGELIHELAVIG
ncbi:FAD-binding oxidoreductase [Infirmifilum lucidum]|uniref:FAD-binding oxidoreductase n=1 Tax=Infirmifilum lucidum TaxID=2776706 RepID=A0A7L9FHW8_9CREN|nr:FAD-binding oxidoreductase [Infirmifilum lucidum]QOJ79418.1 FAD-binding oxidoreductase [Infirmifilum lucidum]